MSIKKLALYGAASIATLGISLAMAGGSIPCAAKQNISGIYVGADVGTFYNNTFNDNYVTWYLTSAGVAGSNIVWHDGGTHVPWGWTASALAGYQFNNHWAAQFGYVWNQKQSRVYRVLTGSQAGNYTLSEQSHNLYLAIKGTMPIVGRLNGFLLGGAAYTILRHKDSKSFHTNTGTKYMSFKGKYFSPMGALGLSYAISQTLSVDLQYMYIDEINPSDIVISLYRDTQRITVGANYLFAL